MLLSGKEETPRPQQCYGRGLCCFTPFWPLFIPQCGSVSLARVTPAFFARSQVFVLFNTLDILSKREGCLRCTENTVERVFVSERQSHSREYGMVWYVIA